MGINLPIGPNDAAETPPPQGKKGYTTMLERLNNHPDVIAATAKYLSNPDRHKDSTAMDAYMAELIAIIERVRAIMDGPNARA